PLHIAATKGCLNAIQVLVEMGANINCVDANGNTPLHWACLYGQDDVIDELIASGACINALNRTGITPLHYAAASKSGTPALEVLMRHKDNLSINSRDKRGRTPLHLAAKFGKISRLLDLFRYGADLTAVDDNQMSALHYAAKEGHFAVIETLIAQPNIDLKAEDRNGSNVLHYACIFKREDVGLKLVEKCPYLVNSTNCDLKTPLHIAAANGLYNLTHKLLLAGASVTASDINNHTPSLCCAKNSDVAECLMIIETVMIMEEMNKKSSLDGEENTTFSPNPRESRHSLLNGVCTQLFTNSSFESTRSSLERSSFDDDKSFEDARQSFGNSGSGSPQCLIDRKSPLNSSIPVTKIVANNHNTNDTATNKKMEANDSDFY
ncbi:serine/threonine-protein phosphatase 6 regulatory ankyrin repeat subunit A-like protein, partial [Leptotrombidium deliense]